MKVPDWFDEKWINTDAKAFGIYITLLYSRFTIRWFRKDIEIPPILGSIRREISRFLAGDDLYEACESSRDFLKTLHKHEAEKLMREKDILDIIENKYYDKFKYACYKYFKRDKIDNGLIIPIRIFLREVKIGIVDRYDVSSSGSTAIKGIKDYLSKYGFTVDENRIIDVLYNSGIFLSKYYPSPVVPAPFLEDEFIEKLTYKEVKVKEEAKEVKIVVKEELEKKYGDEKINQIGRF